MKKRQQIRVGVFETNSSSTHSLTICMKEEYEKFKLGELMFDRWLKKLVLLEDAQEETEEIDVCDKNYFTFEEYQNLEDTFEEEYITPSGDKIVAFGYYSNDNW